MLSRVITSHFLREMQRYEDILKMLVCVFNTHYIGNSIKSAMELNHVFANRSDEMEIYPLTVNEIAEEQTKEVYSKTIGATRFEETWIENTYVLCKNGKKIIP